VLHRSVAERRQVRRSALSDWAHHNDVLCSRSVRAGHDRRTRSGASEAIDDRRHGLVVEHGEVAVVAAAAVLVLVAEVLALTRGDEAGGPDETVLAGDAGLEAAPQRLILDDWRHDLPLDGDPVRLELAGLDPHGQPRPLSDGGHVVVGIHPVGERPPEGFNEFTS
jgi:hypothetical protein